MATNPNALGGMIPGQGQPPQPGFAQPMGGPVMLQPGQMPMQGENFQYQMGMGHPAMGPGMGQPGGQFQFGQGQPNTQFPLNPGMGGPMHGQQVPGMNDWHDAYRNALMNWQAQRPTFGPGTDHQTLLDYKQQRPDRRDYRMGDIPGQPAPTPVALPPQQIMQPMQQPMQPQQPQAPNTYQLPTY